MSNPLSAVAASPEKTLKQDQHPASEDTTGIQIRLDHRPNKFFKHPQDPGLTFYLTADRQVRPVMLACYPNIKPKGPVPVLSTIPESEFIFMVTKIYPFVALSEVQNPDTFNPIFMTSDQVPCYVSVASVKWMRSKILHFKAWYNPQTFLTHVLEPPYRRKLDPAQIPLDVHFINSFQDFLTNNILGELPEPPILVPNNEVLSPILPSKKPIAKTQPLPTNTSQEPPESSSDNTDEKNSVSTSTPTEHSLIDDIQPYFDPDLYLKQPFPIQMIQTGIPIENGLYTISTSSSHIYGSILVPLDQLHFSIIQLEQVCLIKYSIPYEIVFFPIGDSWIYFAVVDPEDYCSAFSSFLGQISLSRKFFERERIYHKQFDQNGKRNNLTKADVTSPNPSRKKLRKKNNSPSLNRKSPSKKHFSSPKQTNKSPSRGHGHDHGSPKPWTKSPKSPSKSSKPRKNSSPKKFDWSRT